MLEAKCDVIELGVPRQRCLNVPENIWALRWRIRATSGIFVSSAWTPEMRYPSITAILEEFEGRIDWLAIDGKNLYDGQTATFIRLPGHLLESLSYKMFGAFHAMGRDIVGGIDVELVTGERYLMLRNGTAHVEESPAHVANDH